MASSSKMNEDNLKAQKDMKKVFISRWCHPLL